MGDWESIFKKEGVFFKKPDKEVKKLEKIFKKNKVKKILDLGCGTGRHTVLLAKEFDVYGMDNSESGLKYTKKWLKELKLNANIKNADCYKIFPYKDKFFDAIISIAVIHHARINDIKFCISEIERILKPNGIIFITVPKTKRNQLRSKVKMIGPRTFIPLDGPEKGLPHYHFNKIVLRKCFKNFKIIDLFTDENKHHCLLSRLK
ncbi:class I SAM-dependent methyltransferase [Nanoarchaeota archaeon]